MTKKRNYPETICGSRQTTDTTAEKIASRQLLAAQLRNGWHNLREEQFWDTVRRLRSEGYL